MAFNGLANTMLLNALLGPCKWIWNVYTNDRIETGEHILSTTNSRFLLQTQDAQHKMPLSCLLGICCMFVAFVCGFCSQCRTWKWNTLTRENGWLVPHSIPRPKKYTEFHFVIQSVITSAYYSSHKCVSFRQSNDAPLVMRASGVNFFWDAEYLVFLPPSLHVVSVYVWCL